MKKKSKNGEGERRRSRRREGLKETNKEEVGAYKNSLTLPRDEGEGMLPGWLPCLVSVLPS